MMRERVRDPAYSKFTVESLYSKVCKMLYVNRRWNFVWHDGQVKCQVHDFQLYTLHLCPNFSSTRLIVHLFCDYNCKLKCDMYQHQSKWTVSFYHPQ